MSRLSLLNHVPFPAGPNIKTRLLRPAWASGFNPFFRSELEFDFHAINFADLVRFKSLISFCRLKDEADLCPAA